MYGPNITAEHILVHCGAEEVTWPSFRSVATLTRTYQCELINGYLNYPSNPDPTLGYLCLLPQPCVREACRGHGRTPRGCDVASVHLSRRGTANRNHKSN